MTPVWSRQYAYCGRWLALSEYIPRCQVEELLEWLRRMHAQYYPPGWDYDPLSAVIEEIERMLE